MCRWEKSNVYRQTDVENGQEEWRKAGEGVLIQQRLPAIHTREEEGRLEHNRLTHSGRGRGARARDPDSELCFCLLSVH